MIFLSLSRRCQKHVDNWRRCRRPWQPLTTLAYVQKLTSSKLEEVMEEEEAQEWDMATFRRMLQEYLGWQEEISSLMEPDIPQFCASTQLVVQSNAVVSGHLSRTLGQKTGECAALDRVADRQQIIRLKQLCFHQDYRSLLHPSKQRCNCCQSQHHNALYQRWGGHNLGPRRRSRALIQEEVIEVIRRFHWLTGRRSRRTGRQGTGGIFVL